MRRLRSGADAGRCRWTDIRGCKTPMSVSSRSVRPPLVAIPYELVAQSLIQSTRLL